MKNVYIKSIGYYIPKGRLSNEEVLAKVRAANEEKFAPDDLELVIYGDSRKFDFLGIETRSIASEHDNDSSVSMALKAASAALEKAGIKIADVDCIIVAGVSNPFREPSLSLVLAKQLGMASGDFFDVNDTCNGFLKSMDIASQYLRTEKYKNVLIVTSENPYEFAEELHIDYSLGNISETDNKFTALLVGCGAAAMVLSSYGEGKRIVNYTEKRETQNWDASILTIPNIKLPDSKLGVVSPGVWTDARLISAQVIRELPDFVKASIALWKMALNDFDLVVMHQLGNNVTFATLDRLKLNYDKAPINTFKECGNMASANIPINLALAEEQGKVTGGDSVLLMSSACGLSYSLTHIEW
jgi:3-oxoacyl-[acyl-carrier-protein] synthase-3